MSELNCNIGGNNTGQACVPIIRVQKKFIAVQTYDNTGTANEIDTTVTLDSAYFAARVNDTDSSKRWYPLPEMKNIKDLRSDPDFQTFDDGSKAFINQGIRAVAGIIVGSDAPPQMVGKINGLRGLGMSIFAIDKEKAIIGKVGSTSTKVAPVELESDSLVAIFGKTVDKAIQQIMVMFDININEDDSQLRVIQANEMSFDVSYLKGLVDVTSVITNKATTGFTAKLVTDGGTIITPVLCKGLVAADFVSSVTGATSKVRNSTDGADVSITGVTESPAGVYEITYTAQTSGDVIILKPKKNGFDFTEVEAATILTP